MENILYQPLFIFFIFLSLSLIFILISGQKSRSKYHIPTQNKIFCINHQKIRSSSLCHICGEPFCDDCIMNHHSLAFCNDHFKLIGKYRWAQILSFESSSNNPDEGINLQTFKEMIWKEEEIPSYIVVDYRINFEKDLIESHISYYTREQDQDVLSKRFRRYKNQA